MDAAWTYVDASKRADLPPDRVEVLVSCRLEESRNGWPDTWVALAYHVDGRWVQSGGLPGLHCVYAWSFAPTPAPRVRVVA
jgi:hypothetical protein